MPDEAVRTRWASLVLRHSQDAAVPAQVMAGIISVESGFDSLAFNGSSGATGLTQVLPRYWEHTFVEDCGPASRSRLRRPEVAICVGARVLGHFLERSEGRLRVAVNAYNNGTGANNGYADAVFRHMARNCSS